MDQEQQTTTEEALYRRIALLEHQQRLSASYCLETALAALKHYQAIRRYVLNPGQTRGLDTCYGIINSLLSNL